MNEGKPAYTCNWFGLEHDTAESPEAIAGESAEIKLTFDYDGGGADGDPRGSDGPGLRQPGDRDDLRPPTR